MSTITVDSGSNIATSCKIYDSYIAYEDQIWCEGRQNVRLIGSWGYASVPHDIQYVCSQICVNFLKEAIRTRLFPDIIAASITGAQPVDERGIVGVLRTPRVLTLNEREILDRYRYREIEAG